MLYRLDGDGFGILLLEETVRRRTHIYGKLQKTSASSRSDRKEYFCTLSAGYAAYPGTGVIIWNSLRAPTIPGIFQNHGKNRMTVFSRDILADRSGGWSCWKTEESVERGLQGSPSITSPR